MNVSKKKIVCLVFVIFIGVGALFASSVQTDKPGSIEMAFNTKFLSKLNTPQYIWLQDGTACLLDSRVEPEKRVFEILDPRSGKRKPVPGSLKALDFFKKELGDNAPDSVSWPDTFSADGKQAVYLLDDDVFLVDLIQGTGKRLTKTSSVEESIAFSPDGRWVSFIRDNDIYIINTASGAEKKLTTGSTDTLLNGKLSWVYWEEVFNHADVPYSWSPDSGAIAYLQSDDSQVPVCEFVHYKPVTPKIVRQHYPKAGQPNPNVRLGVVEIDPIHTTWINCGDYEYLVRFNWLPNNQHIAVQTMNRKQSNLKLWLADRKTGASKIMIEENQPTWINLHDSLSFFKKSDSFTWMSERDGYQHLYLYSLKGGECKPVRQLTKGEFMVMSLSGVDENNGWVYFIANKKALKERHLYRVKMDGAGLQQLSEGEGDHNIEMAPGMNVYLDTFSSFSKPGELNLHKPDGEKISNVTPAAQDVLASWKLQTPEFNTYKTGDGLDVPIMMVKPLDFDPAKIKTYPALIYVYGGPGAQQVIDRWNSRGALWYNILNREGYFVFVVEVRAGMGKNKAVESSVYKHAYGLQNVKDILDAVEWMKKIPSINPDRIGIWGGSGGGTTTIFTMTHSNVFKAGISLFPVSDWLYYDSNYTERYLSTPEDNPEGYKETSAVLSAPELKGKLFIAHGTYDDNVHPQNTYAFIDRLIEKNIQFDLMIYPWRKHGVSDYPGRVHLYTMMLNFWRRTVGK